MLQNYLFSQKDFRIFSIKSLHLGNAIEKIRNLINILWSIEIIKTTFDLRKQILKQRKFDF